MASNQTEHYELNQWSASDPVLREEFNADNATIDAALATIPKITAGEYTGNGAASRFIPLPFTPKILYLCTGQGYTFTSGNYGWSHFGGLAMQDNPQIGYNSEAIITLMENGFTVVYKYHRISEYNHYYNNTNGEGTQYRYFAIG